MGLAWSEVDFYAQTDLEIAKQLGTTMGVVRRYRARKGIFRQSCSEGRWMKPMLQHIGDIWLETGMPPLYEEMMERTGLSRAGISVRLQKLQERGLIALVGRSAKSKRKPCFTDEGRALAGDQYSHEADAAHIITRASEQPEVSAARFGAMLVQYAGADALVILDHAMSAARFALGDKINKDEQD